MDILSIQTTKFSEFIMSWYMIVFRILLMATKIQTYTHEDNPNLIHYLQTSHSAEWYTVCQKIREHSMINMIVLGNRSFLYQQKIWFNIFLLLLTVQYWKKGNFYNTLHVKLNWLLQRNVIQLAYIFTNHLSNSPWAYLTL